MAQATSIEWTEATWNPVTGCTKISPGCKHCYAERMTKRLQAMGQPRYADGFRVTLQPDLVDQPLRWRKPRRIFVNSMSDLLHPDVPLEFIRRVFRTMEEARRHQFQILTKRADRLRDVAGELPWPEDVWMGVSVESEDYVWRVERLAEVPAAVRFLSLEPLLGPLCDLPLAGIHWVIVGGESGPRARPMEAAWVRDIRRQCLERGVAFFFKQCLRDSGAGCRGSARRAGRARVGGGGGRPGGARARPDGEDRAARQREFVLGVRRANRARRGRRFS